MICYVCWIILDLCAFIDGFEFENKAKSQKEKKRNREKQKMRYWNVSNSSDPYHGTQSRIEKKRKMLTKGHMIYQYSIIISESWSDFFSLLTDVELKGFQGLDLMEY